MKKSSSAVVSFAFSCLLGIVVQTAALAQAGNPHAISLYNLGLTAYKQGSPESAIIFFKRACDIDPDLADAQYNLGVIYQSEKRVKEAVPRFQEVLRIKPSDPDAHYQLGLCFIDLGQPADARQTLAGIPPNDKHYADAQKRISLIDAQLPQSGSSSATAPTQLANPINQVNQVNQPAYGQPQAGGYDPTTNTQQAQQLPTSAQPLTQIQPQQQVAPALPPKQYVSPAGPAPILANSTVRVIATGFSAPAGLAFDHNGNLYIANFTSNSIDRISPDGTKTAFSSGSNLKGPIGVAVDASGNVYVANYSGGTLARINPAGVSTVIATGFRKPYYLTMDKEGNLYVSQQEDNSIVRITLPRPIGARP